jgi:hypothetical protein
MAFLIPSIQFFCVFSRAVFCFGIHYSAVLGNLFSVVLWTWPYHVSWFCSISFIIVSSSPICCLNSYISNYFFSWYSRGSPLLLIISVIISYIMLLKRRKGKIMDKVTTLTLSDPMSDLVRQYAFPVPLRCRKTSDTVFVAFVRPLSEPFWRFSSCSTDFSQQIAQVVLSLFLHVFLF